ncbi:hypothetical protein PIIN_00337 [Serendipita indica DSM 11827]|uniref:Protein arginine methyltransferase NDUFAF7 n=1 Tax=Serendipita indica (strain DSM 11827) TaxID=1109443 RepID=G4T5R7_SERID|nr:hypothetical protein PIIN_00337 [Serendipita indica DSM 11827]
MTGPLAKRTGLGPLTSVHLVETSKALQEKQQATLADYSQSPISISWHADIDDVPRQTLRFAKGRQVTPVPFITSNPRFSSLPLGSRIEYSRASVGVMRSIAELMADGGLGLVIDYGAEHAFSSSLRGVRRHAIVEPFTTPGDCDLTANVDFATLRDAIRDIPGGLRILNCYIALIILASVINGYDSSVLNGMIHHGVSVLKVERSFAWFHIGLQMLPEFKKHFNSPDGSTLGFMSAAQNFGGLVALSIGCFIVVGGVVLQVLAANVGHFIASRCIIGVGICMIVNAAPVLITELSYPTQRGALTALFNTVWYFGSIFSAVPSMLQAVFAMILGTFVLFIPESPRRVLSYHVLPI